MAPSTITAEVNGRTMTWTPGIIGTAAWTREATDARAMREGEAERELIDRGIAGCDPASGFYGCAAPSGAGETSEAHPAAIGGCIGDAPATPFSVRSLVRDARVVGRQRAHRRAVLATARENERKRRATLRGASVPATESPLVRLAQDVAQGTFPRPGATVTERVYIVRGDEDTIVTRKRPNRTRNYRRVLIDAPGFMLALERLVREYRGETAQYVAAMESEPNRDGRGTVAHRAPDAVNGTEVRGMPRWHGTPAASVRGENGRLIDRTCYRVLPNGRRVPLVTTATARARKAASVAAVEATVQRLTAASLPRVVVD